MSTGEIQKAETRFQKYGSMSMLLAWMPVIGDPLTVAAGLLKMNFWLFIFLVFIGKFARYFVLVLGVDML